MGIVTIRILPVQVRGWVAIDAQDAAALVLTFRSKASETKDRCMFRPLGFFLPTAFVRFASCP